MNNYYKTLGLEELASIEEVKKAFKKLAIAYHPDKNPDNPVAEELFKQINEAYQILSDPIAKSRYDYLLQFAYSYKYYAQERPYEAPKNHQSYHTPTRQEPKNTNLYATIFAFAVLAYMFMVVGSIYDFVSKYSYYQALQAYQVKDYEAVINKLNISLGYDPYFAPAYYLRAKLYNEYHRYPTGALKDFTKAIEAAPIRQSHFFLERGLTYSQMQQKEGAIYDLNTVLQLTDFEPLIADEIAKEYQYKLQEYDLAIDVYGILLQQTPQQGKIYYQRGIAYATLNKKELAQKDFDSAVVKSTNPLAERFAIALALKNEVKNYGLAIQNASLLVKEHPQETDYYLLRAIIYMDNNQPEAALRDLSVAIAYQPNKLDYYKIRATVLLSLSRTQEACTDWLTAKRLGNKEKHHTLDFFCTESDNTTDSLAVIK